MPIHDTTRGEDASALHPRNIFLATRSSFATRFAFHSLLFSQQYRFLYIRLEFSMLENSRSRPVAFFFTFINNFNLKNLPTISSFLSAILRFDAFFFSFLFLCYLLFYIGTSLDSFFLAIFATVQFSFAARAAS